MLVNYYISKEYLYKIYENLLKKLLKLNKLKENKTKIVIRPYNRHIMDATTKTIIEQKYIHNK